ncbi:MAG: type IV pilus modification PilV family protein [Bryobacteraceae bacterium]
MRRHAGFTLLEVLVATTILGLAVAGLLGNLTASMRNQARVAESDNAARTARRTMDELLSGPPLPRSQVVEGRNEAGGWRARASIFERPPGAAAGNAVLERIELEVWWMNGGEKRTFALDAFRSVTLAREDP